MKKSNVSFTSQMCKKNPRNSNGVIKSISILTLISRNNYLCILKHLKDLFMEKKAGADLKSATVDDTKKLFIETYGCQMNVADSEVVASVMKMAGYEVTENLDEADVVFLNTCSIRENAEQKIFNRLEFFHAMRRKGR